jgi:hypothetical protein
MKALPKVKALEQFQPATARKDARIFYRYDVAEGSTLSRGERIASWICRVLAAGIMLETLYFKFTGAPESVYIFTRMALEPTWRYGQGVWELIASVCLLTPRLGWLGGVLTLGAIGAALISHLTILGIEIQGDHGLLFAMAVTAFLSALGVTVLHRHEIPHYSSAPRW